MPVLSLFSKLYEKCMYLRLYSFLLKFKILFNRQFGFRNDYSTKSVDLLKKYLGDPIIFVEFLLTFKRSLIL